MHGSNPDGSCSPEKSEPTRLGLDTDDMDSEVGAASSNIACLRDPSSRLGDIHDRRWTAGRRPELAFVA